MPTVYRKSLIHEGTHSGIPGHGTINITERELKHWASTFRKMKAAGFPLRLPIEHRHGAVPAEAAAHATVLSVDVGRDHRGRRALIGKFVFNNERVASRLTSGPWDVSIFSPAKFEWAGQEYVRPLCHVASTRHPAIRDLGPWQAVPAGQVAEPAARQPLAASRPPEQQQAEREFMRRIRNASPAERKAAAAELERVLAKIRAGTKPATAKPRKTMSQIAEEKAAEFEALRRGGMKPKPLAVKK